MTIDMNFHPIFFDILNTPDDELKKREKEFGIFKQSPYSMNEIVYEMDFANIDCSVLMPLDLCATTGTTIVTNKEVSKIVAAEPERFIGFASVDPNDVDAPKKLINAFDNLGLSGVNFHPGKQKIYPNDPRMDALYKICLERNKPVYFHSGLSWEPNSYTKFCYPLCIEDVLIKYPDLRVCAAHFSWPWIKETEMLMIKYKNFYTDTSMLYMNSFDEFFEDLFESKMTPLTVERNFPKQIMFGSNTPRFRGFKIKRALDKIPFSEDIRENLYENNAKRYLYGDDKIV